MVKLFFTILILLLLSCNNKSTDVQIKNGLYYSQNNELYTGNVTYYDSLGILLYSESSIQGTPIGQWTSYVGNLDEDVLYYGEHLSIDKLKHFLLLKTKSENVLFKTTFEGYEKCSSLDIEFVNCKIKLNSTIINEILDHHKFKEKIYSISIWNVNNNKYNLILSKDTLINCKSR
jgi:hypothetical protein